MKYWLLALLTTVAVLIAGWFTGVVPVTLPAVAGTLVGVFAAAVFVAADNKARFLGALGVLVLGAGAQWLVHWSGAPFVIAAGVGLMLAAVLWATAFARQPSPA